LNEDKYRSWDILCKIIGFLAVIVTIIIGSCQYSATQEKEYKKPFWSEQLKTCIDASKAASKIAVAADTKIPEKYINDLFEIYFSRGALTLDFKSLTTIRIIGNRAVRCNAGTESSDSCIRPVFNGLAFDVAETCRETITKSWDIPIEKLGKEALDIVLPE
jgi:hypothetical protein